MEEKSSPFPAWTNKPLTHCSCLWRSFFSKTHINRNEMACHGGSVETTEQIVQPVVSRFFLVSRRNKRNVYYGWQGQHPPSTDSVV